MLKSKNGEQLKELTTNQFAEEILNNPNRIFCFLTKPEDDYCFFLASVDVFKTQTIVINGGRFFKDEILPCPGFSHAFSIDCYNVQFGYAKGGEDECLPDIINGLNSFEGIQGKNNSTWYVVDDDMENILETVHHWK